MTDLPLLPLLTRQRVQFILLPHSDLPEVEIHSVDALRAEHDVRVPQPLIMVPGDPWRSQEPALLLI